MRKRPTIVLASLAVIFGAIQLVPVERTNPPSPAPLQAPTEISSILDRCCSDCHTNETRWPWYAYVAPASWLVAHDVKEGRINLDFSYWGELPHEEQRHLATSIIRQVNAGTMPPLAYRILHPRSRPRAAEAELLRAWFSSPEFLQGTNGGSTGLDSGPGDFLWDVED